MIQKKQTIFAAAAAFMAIILIIFAAPLKASAEAHGSFYIPNGAVPAGSQFSVSIEFTASESIGTVSAAVTYNESFMEFVSSDNASGGGGIVNVNGFPDSESSSMTVTLTFKALQEGSSQINMVNGSVMTPDGVSLSNAVSAYATITIGPASPDQSGGDSQDPDDSTGSSQPAQSGSGSEAVLRSLTVEVGELKPEFSPGIYNYTVTVSHDVDVFELEGVTADETDTIWYEGSLYLADGKNQRTITVTSADGLTSNVYTITIYRESGEDDEYAEDEQDENENEEISENITDADSVGTDKSSSQISDPGAKDKTGMDDLRDKLMPALYIAMAVIVLAVVILIVWIRSKSKNKLR